MQIIINREKKDGGASSIELRTSNSCILIGLGMPLITDKPGGIDGILISHLLPNHYTRLKQIDQAIPIYMSKPANELINIHNTFAAKNDCKPNILIIKHMRPFQIKDFKVTPYLIDDSALSALTFSIKAGAKSAFYINNLTNNSKNNSILIEKIFKDHPQGLDCLLTDSLETEDCAQNNKRPLQVRIETVLRTNKNITFLHTPSEDIDGIVSAYSACSKTGLIFVIDIYTAFLLDKLRKVSKAIPQLDWKNTKIRFTKDQADLLANAGYNTLLYAYNKHKIDLFDINRYKRNILMTVRDNTEFTGTIKDIDRVTGAKLISTVREGCLSEKLKGYCAQKGIEIEYIPAYTYKKAEALKVAVNALSPKTIIPIQLSPTVKYSQLSSNIKIIDSKEVIDIR